MTRPNVPVPSTPPGLANCGELKALKNSVRNSSSCDLSNGIGNALETERSNVESPGPTRGFRGEVPYTPTLRENAVILNHAAGSGLESSAVTGRRCGRDHVEVYSFIIRDDAALGKKAGDLDWACGMLRGPLHAMASDMPGGNRGTVEGWWGQYYNMQAQGMAMPGMDPSSTDERRRYYRLTCFGRRVAAADVERLNVLLQQARATGLVPGA